MTDLARWRQGFGALRHQRAFGTWDLDTVTQSIQDAQPLTVALTDSTGAQFHPDRAVAARSEACFFAEQDYCFHLDWLGEYAGKFDCRVHGYVLMSNHVHLLLSADDAGAAGSLMKALVNATCNTSTAATGAAGRCGEGDTGRA